MKILLGIRFRNNSKFKLTFILIFYLLFTITNVSGVIHLPPKVIQSPGDSSYVFGTTGNELVWIFEAEESEDHPTIYNITIDSILLTDHTNKAWFDNVEIIVNVDGLQIGVHIVEIIVADDGVPEFAPAFKENVKLTVLEEETNLSTMSQDTSSDKEENNSNSSDTTVMSILLTSSILFTLIIVNGRHKK